MMLIRRFGFLLCVGAGLVAGKPLRALPVDFTPHPYEYRFDGAIFTGFKFIHGKERIIYLPPAGWTYLGSGDAASLRAPEETSTVRAEITHKENTVLPTWDQEGIDALTKRAEALLPPVNELKIIEVCKKPFQIGGCETIRVDFTGQMLAQNYKFVVVLVPFADEQFGFVMYAEKKEFEAAATRFMSSLNTLRWEKPTP